MAEWFNQRHGRLGDEWVDSIFVENNIYESYGDYKIDIQLYTRIIYETGESYGFYRGILWEDNNMIQIIDDIDNIKLYNILTRVLKLKKILK